MKCLLGLVSAMVVCAPSVYGQGCIIARSNGVSGGPASEGGYLAPGEFNFTVSYRHQFSFRHFVGSVEQKQRIAAGSQIMNKLNLENVSVTYQATPRFSFTADLPVMSASRRGNSSPTTTLAHGIGDMAFMANAWLWNPTENNKGNIQLGVGFVVPTGDDNVHTTVDSFNGKGPQPTLDDYSIQPGTGGYGIALQWAAFKNVKSAQLYFNGNYLITPQNTNNILRGSNPASSTAYVSISDQYLLQPGIAVPVRKIRGLTATFGPRMEGVPARDLIGNSLGFRRPGYAISLEPGAQYYRGHHSFSVSVGRAIFRNRTRSVPDIISGGHGDAAFADWVWFASYSFRWNPRHSYQSMPVDQHATANQAQKPRA